MLATNFTVSKRKGKGDRSFDSCIFCSWFYPNTDWWGFFPELQFIKLLFIPANVLDKRTFRIALFQVVSGGMSIKPSGSSPVGLPTRPSLLGYSILPLICTGENT